MATLVSLRQRVSLSAAVAGHQILAHVPALLALGKPERKAHSVSRALATHTFCTIAKPPCRRGPAACCPACSYTPPPSPARPQPSRSHPPAQPAPRRCTATPKLAPSGAAGAGRLTTAPAGVPAGAAPPPQRAPHPIAPRREQSRCRPSPPAGGPAGRAGWTAVRRAKRLGQVTGEPWRAGLEVQAIDGQSQQAACTRRHTFTNKPLEARSKQLQSSQQGSLLRKSRQASPTPPSSAHPPGLGGVVG